MANGKVQLTYKCDCCHSEFVSHRARAGEKLCSDCIELRRALKGFLKHGLSEADVLKRGKKLLKVNGRKAEEPKVEAEAEVTA